jgi:glyoxylase-like metal-dependent hydrolase (beta-lactamase superfamily II)
MIMVTQDTRDLTRRSLLATAAAAGTATAMAPLASRSAAAAAPAKGTGVYRYKLGEYEIIQLMDGAFTFPISDQLVVNVSRDEAINAAAAAYMPEGKVTIPFSPMIVNTGKKLVAIDTGNGLGAHAISNDVVGQARGNMKAAGIDPAKIDIVVISHFHSDHIGRLKNANGSPAFPGAEIKVPAVEWAFWSDESNASNANGYNAEQFATVQKMLDGFADRVTIYEGDAEVAPGITAIHTPGHTPGHMSFVVVSDSKRIFVQSDVTIIPSFFLRHPDWHVVFDNDPRLAATTRHKIYDMAAAEKLTVCGYHFPYPCVGHVEKSPGIRITSELSPLRPFFCFAPGVVELQGHDCR